MHSRLTSNYKRILEFLSEIDSDFPVQLSEKIGLEELATKLANNATICTEIQDDKIIGMVAGYTNNTVNNMGYISIVGVLKNHRGKHVASSLITQFLEIAQKGGLDGVHLYTHSTNLTAIKLYETMGFVLYKAKNEPRPDDIHFIYLFNNGGSECAR